MKKFRKFDGGGPTDEMDMDVPAAKAPQDISFKEAFGNARQAGLKTFNFGGKKYTTDMASPKAAVSAAKTAAPSKPSAPTVSISSNPNEIPSSGNYRQDTYETPLKSAVRRMAPEVMDNLGKIIGGLGVGAGAYYGGSKLINAANAADKVRDTAALARGNAGLAERMKGIVSGAEDAVAARAAAKAARQPYNEATAERLTGLSMNPRRANIPVSEGEFRKGGKVKKYAKGGSVSSASSRADGCAVKGKTKGKYC